MPDLARAVDAALPRIAAGGRLIYIGAGTSGRLGVLDSVELNPTFSWPRERARALMAGGDSAMYVAVEGAEDDGPQGSADLHRLVDLHCALARGALDAPEDKRTALILDGLRALLMQEKAGQGWELDDAALFSLFDDELDVNAQGLLAWEPQQ